MTKYVSLVNLRLGNFVAWRLEHVSRDSNEKADALAAVAASQSIKETMLLPIYYHLKSSITSNRANEIDKACPSWMTPIVRYLGSGEFLDNKVVAHKIQVHAAQFSLVNGQLYKRQQRQYVLVKIHDGVCRNHPSSRMLAHRAHT